MENLEQQFRFHSFCSMDFDFLVLQTFFVIVIHKNQIKCIYALFMKVLFILFNFVHTETMSRVRFFSTFYFQHSLFNLQKLWQGPEEGECWPKSTKACQTGRGALQNLLYYVIYHISSNIVQLGPRSKQSLRIKVLTKDEH